MSEPVSTIFPSDEEEPTTEELLLAAEQAVLASASESDNTDDLVVTEPEPIPLGRSPVMDFQAGAFLSGSAGLLTTRGLGTLEQWIEKCLRTDRGAHPVHPDGYGMVRPTDLIGRPVDEVPVAELENRIRDALTFHPRISEVSDFVTDYNPDDERFDVGFTVHTDQVAFSFRARLP